MRVCGWVAFLGGAAWAGAQGAPDDAPVPLEPLFVDASGEQTEGYDPTGMGMREAETYESPFSNEIIWDELPPDELDLAADEELAAIGGASPAEIAVSGVQLRLRGFPTPQLRDSYSQTGVPEILNVGRTQTIQGPLVPVLGRGAPGGIRNFLTNRPRARAQTRLEIEFNDQDDREAALRWSGPLVRKKLWGRAAVGVEEQRGPQAFAWGEQHAFTAAATVRPTRSTSAMVQLDHERYRGNPAPGLPEARAAAGGPLLGPYRPLAEFHGYGPEAGVRREVSTATVQLETQLTPQLVLRVAVQGLERDLVEERFTRGVFEQDRGVFGGVREPLHFERPLTLAGVQADLTGRFRLLGLEHKLFLAAEEIRSDGRQEQRALTAADRDRLLPEDVRTFDPAAPNFFRPAYAPDVYRRIITARDEAVTYRGVALSDRTAWAGGRVVATAGGRFDTVALALDDRRTGAVRARVEDEAEELTWHAGVNVVLVPGRLLAFANASTAFEPSTRVDARTGRIQGNETTRGFELGVKGMVPRRFNYTLFYYDLTNDNISRRNPRYNDPVLDPALTEPELLAAGEESFRGGFVDLRWRGSARWSVNTSVTLTDATTVRSPDLPEEEGRALVRTPRVQARLSTRYAWDAGWLRGFDAGLGVTHTGAFTGRYADADRVALNYPAVTLVRAQVGYAWKGGRTSHEVGVSVANLFDVDLLARLDQVGRGRTLGVDYELQF